MGRITIAGELRRLRETACHLVNMTDSKEVGSLYGELYREPVARDSDRYERLTAATLKSIQPDLKVVQHKTVQVPRTEDESYVIDVVVDDPSSGEKVRALIECRERGRRWRDPVGSVRCL